MSFASIPSGFFKIFE